MVMRLLLGGFKISIEGGGYCITKYLHPITVLRLVLVSKQIAYSFNRIKSFKRNFYK